MKFVKFNAQEYNNSNIDLHFGDGCTVKCYNGTTGTVYNFDRNRFTFTIAGYQLHLMDVKEIAVSSD